MSEDHPPPRDAHIEWRGAFRDPAQAETVLVALGFTTRDYLTLVKMYDDVLDSMAPAAEPATADDRDTPDRIMAARMVRAAADLELGRAYSFYGLDEPWAMVESARFLLDAAARLLGQHRDSPELSPDLRAAVAHGHDVAGMLAARLQRLQDASGPQ